MPPGYQDPDCTVFVTNVESRVTEEILWELFLQAGPLRNVHIPVDRATGKTKSFAFVVYRDDCSVLFACELFNSLKLFQRSIYCKPTRDSKQSKFPAETSNVFDTPEINDFGRNNSARNSVMNSPWLDDSPGPHRRDYFSNGEDIRHVDHQRNNFHDHASPQGIPPYDRYHRRMTDDSPHFYNTRQQRYHGNSSYDENQFDRRYDDRRYDGGRYRGGNFGESPNNFNPMHMQGGIQNIDQFHRESSFGNEPLRYGPQRDDLMPAHRTSRRQRPY